MTLDTNIYVHGEVDPRVVFDYCRALLGADERHPFVDDPEGWRRDGSRILRNQAGVGLPALLYLHYCDGAPLTTPEQSAACDEACGEDCTGEWHTPAAWLAVSFDTAYGYQDERGRGCGELHASLVTRLGEWLDERGIAWSWRNEYTGEVHGGEARYVRLFDLISGSDEARAWFTSTVLPAIERDIASRQGESSS